MKKNVMLLCMVFPMVFLFFTCAQKNLFQVNLTLSSDGNGTVEPSGTTAVDQGTSVTINATPSLGYTFAEWKVGSGNPSINETDNPSTTVILSGDTGIVALFTNSVYKISASAGTGGSITPSGDISVVFGENRQFIINSNSCYTIADVNVDGTSVGPTSSYTFSSIDSSHTISASFEKKRFTVTTFLDSPGGTISSSATYNCGDNAVIRITPDSCYKVKNVKVDGGYIGAVQTYTIPSIDSDHTISASFEIATYTFTLNVNIPSNLPCPGMNAYVIMNGSYYVPGTYSFSFTGCQTVTLSPSPPSSPCEVSPGTNLYLHFSSWGGTESSSANPLTLDVNSNMTITAYFIPNTSPN